MKCEIGGWICEKNIIHADGIIIHKKETNAGLKKEDKRNCREKDEPIVNRN